MVIKCKMCGGDLILKEDSSLATCAYCGSTMTVPLVDDERMANLYNRANHLRMNSEFDKAAASYEDIILENAESAEAHWGLCLCRYGIEYVDDPVSGKKKPTCHRTLFMSILEDSDYHKAWEMSDVVARKQYEEEAREIDRIQKQILQISSREEPFDIFICYKETGIDGERTRDSVFAQDIYTALTQEGYKVFFSRITLEDKLGVAYEPYIFSALNSAQIMLVIGTKPEHLNAVWVKNEWSRFLAMAHQDKRKFLIPLYSMMSPYDMPNELAGLQAVDMSKIGFMQDLLRGVGKVVQKPVAGAQLQQPQVVHQMVYTGNAQALVQRGNMALAEKNWTSASEFFEAALNQEAESAEAYFGKYLVAMKYSSMEDMLEQKLQELENMQGTLMQACVPETELLNQLVRDSVVSGYLSEEEIRAMCKYDLSYYSRVTMREERYQRELHFAEENIFISRAIQFADDNFKRQLEQLQERILKETEASVEAAKQEDIESVERITKSYEAFLKDAERRVAESKRNAEAHLEQDYIDACKAKEIAATAEELDGLAALFEKLSFYKDSAVLAAECRQKEQSASAKEKEAALKLERDYAEACDKKVNARAKEDWAVAAKLFAACGDYKNSRKYFEQCQKQAEKMSEKKSGWKFI